MTRTSLAKALLIQVLLLAAAAPVWAVDANRVKFGELADGTAIEAVEFANAKGVTARVMTLGATLQSLAVPARDGKVADVVLGYATAAEYLAKPQYFGATVGRYENRIAGGQFTLDGRRYILETNDGPHHLHGGLRGFDKVVWTIASVSSGSPARVVMTHVSPDGDGGYPGTLTATAIYSLSEQNELTIEYQATTDKPTIVNMANHSFFNLAGEAAGADVMSHRLTLFADFYTPVSETLIPTGERRSVEGTPFDFRKSAMIGSRIRDGRDQQIVFGRGYDHNFVLNGKAGALRTAVRLEDPGSGRVMELLTGAPGIQFYSGNFLNGTIVGKSGRVYRQGDGLCLEPQVFPDSPNHPDFPSPRLDPGKTYKNTTVLRFSVSRS